ncbi:MAG TPA: DUF3078 domain-containing protein [Cyclobacteriaceae bacterium]|nr:DUF3078 domain-containing protein [Cyclobacteriaceae bacterium]HMV10893.1 DUF3078 domain-containing protein [Cyclobacteriaceae bacterium]HMV88878.1 DUF3078 domain-containing protein [Cyclobacteriaceae bacterium]HMW99666.1 DUF3078 domain-containing protein [Cyclobacteriaceae bacterium]HMX50957.1 DUF3078 domain-containing protein [Cyclobacteriaceae bacterium]
MKYTRLLVLVIAGLLVLPLFVNAQIVVPDSTSKWRKKMIFNLNLNQAAFSSNWKGGGINSIGLNTNFDYKADYKDDKQSWDNEIGFTYGFVKNSGQGYRKTLDRFFVDTKYGRSLSKKWDAFASFNFASQFYKGYKYSDDGEAALISDFLAPAFVTVAVGFEYHPVDYFKVRISPLAPRLTLLRNNNGRFDAVDSIAPYGVEVGEDTRFEWLAFQLTADFDKDIAKNLNLKFKYLMFANYETLEGKTIDHRLDLMLNAKVNRFITVSAGGILLYDFDQDDEVQLSQAFNIGFTYSIQNYIDK